METKKKKEYPAAMQVPIGHLSVWSSKSWPRCSSWLTYDEEGKLEERVEDGVEEHL